MNPLLSVSHLTQSLKIDKKRVDIVKNISFDLFQGKTYALIGESGSGKTLTFHSLLRLLPSPPFFPPVGEAFFHNQNLLTLSRSKLQKIRGSSISLIFQNPSSALNPVLTIGFQLMEVVSAHLRLKGKEAEMRVLHALEEVKLPNPEAHMKQYPHQMSGGMLQRVMIAMALLTSPDILIADEPTTALDVTIQKQILILLKELQVKKNMTLLIITHDFGVVATMADFVFVMHKGEIVERGDVFSIFDSPSHPYTQNLLNLHLAKT